MTLSKVTERIRLVSCFFLFSLFLGKALVTNLGTCPYYFAQNTNMATVSYYICYMTTPVYPGDTLVIGSCAAVNQAATCSGDQYLRLFDGRDAYSNQVAVDDDGCGPNQLCSKITYTVPAWAPCKIYYIRQGCYENLNCGAVVEIYKISLDYPSAMPSEFVRPSLRPSPWPTANPSLSPTPAKTAPPNAWPTNRPTESSSIEQPPVPVGNEEQTPLLPIILPTESPSIVLAVDVGVSVKSDDGPKKLVVVNLVFSILGSAAGVVSAIYIFFKMYLKYNVYRNENAATPSRSTPVVTVI